MHTDVSCKKMYINDLLSSLLLKHRKLPSNIGRTYKTEKAYEACKLCTKQIRKGSMVRQLWCGHIMHTRCVDKWLILHALRCPVCDKVSLRQS
jgi:hypothetical protein